MKVSTSSMPQVPLEWQQLLIQISPDCAEKICDRREGQIRFALNYEFRIQTAENYKRMDF